MSAQVNLTRSVVTVLALALAPFAAFGQGTDEQQQACAPDAVKLCSDTIPDIPKTTACMKAHFAQLSPRCQSAFNEATGGSKPATKAAARKEPRRAETAKAEVTPPAARSEPRSPARAERRMPERDASVPRRAPSRVEREDREQIEQDERNAPVADAPTTPGYPPYPAPAAPAASGYQTATPRGQIASACRAGLIDSFTCSTTVPALLGGPAY